MEDNIIAEIDKEWLDIVNEYQGKGKLSKDWFPIMTYDMVQSGYPRPDHGIMIPRECGGTDEQDNLLPGNGMWCKVEDVKKLLKLN